MQLSNRVVTLAQKEAVAAFSQLADAIVQTADIALGEALLTATGYEQRQMAEANAFLRKQGGAFRQQINTNYQTLLGRAMRTMHTDLRSGMGDVRADALTLIEDDVVTRAIEVDRLVMRLRNADTTNLAPLNLIIAQLHGVSEVSERENPFRPYLLARALHDTVRQMVNEQARANVLFQFLSTAMAGQLVRFYSRIRNVFESQGVRTRLMARPSALNRHERERLALKRAADELYGKVETVLEDPDSDLRARMLPRMQRMLELVQHEGTLVQQATAGAAPAAGQEIPAKPAKELQELVWEVFHQPRGNRLPRATPEQAGASRLDQSLVELQREAATASAYAPPDAPLALRDRVSDLATPQDRLTIDLVALLFEFIQHDEQMHAPMRLQLLRLHLPFLRAALLQPTLLHDASHPARRMLDRAGSLAVTVGGNSRMDAAMLGEMMRLVSDILLRFDCDAGVFAEAEAALDQFFARQLALREPTVPRARAALARADLATSVLDAMRQALRKLLEPIKIDRRMIEFISEIWVHVLFHCQDSHPAYREMLAELIWSAQEKPGPEDRAILLRLLPDLGKRLRAGLAQIGMPDTEAKEALDKLMVLHMDVLANKRLRSNAVRMSQQAIQEELGRFRPDHLFALARTEGRVGASPADIAASLAVEGIRPEMIAAPEATAEQAEDLDCFKWARPGTPFELQVERDYRPIMLELASEAGLAFMFRHPQQAAPVVYTRSALLAAMRDGRLRPVEHAPLFERAVESLMTGVESLAA